MPSHYFFTSVEFYIILAVIAAAIIAFVARPAEKGPVQDYLVAGDLEPGQSGADPVLDIKCLGDGTMEITRRAIPGVTDSGAVSLAIQLKGRDISIEERIVPGKGAPIVSTDAVFHLKFITPGRYHFNYNSQPTGLFVAFPFNVVPGLESVKVLHA